MQQVIIMKPRGRTRAQVNFSLLWRFLITNTSGKCGVTWKRIPKCKMDI